MGGKFNPYEVLGVPKNATKQQIMRAYRDLAKKWHPDQHKEESEKKKASEKFTEISRAYEYLSNDEKRAKFDRYGTVDEQEMSSEHVNDIFRQFFNADGASSMFNGGGAGGGMPGFSFSFGGDDFGGFGGMPGGGRPGGGQFRQGRSGQQQQQPAKPLPKHKNKVVTVEMTLEDNYKGCTKYMNVETSVGGSNYKSEQHVLKIPAGMKAGSRFTFEGKGDSSPNHAPGDLVFVTKIHPHPIYKLEPPHDLIQVYSVSLREALETRPRKYHITAIDGSKHEILIPENEIIGQDKIIKGKGMPKTQPKGQFGDMIVRFHVKIPEMSKETREKLLQNM